MNTTILLGLFGLRLLAPPTTTASSPVTVLVGAEIHVGDGTIIRDGVIEIIGTEIRRVGGPTLRSEITASAKIVDVAGKIVTPGLIAADTTLGLVEIGLEASTVDTERAGDHPIRAAYDPAEMINADSFLIPVQAIEGITNAAVAPQGGLISGAVTWIDLASGSGTSMVAARAVAIDATFGQAVGGSRAASLTALRQALVDTRFLRSRRADADRGQTRPLAAHPLDLMALGPVVDRKIPLTIAVDRATDILALVELAKEQKIRVVIVGGAEAWRVRKQIAAAKVPVVVQPTRNLPGSFSELGARNENAALLHEAGVELAIAILGEPHNVRNVRQEAGIAVSYGLPHEAALTAITRNVARIYGMDANYGTIASGRKANLVVWSGDPLELSSWPEHVMIRGELVPPHSRQTRLRDRYMDLTKYRP